MWNREGDICGSKVYQTSIRIYPIANRLTSPLAASTLLAPDGKPAMFFRLTPIVKRYTCGLGFDLSRCSPSESVPHALRIYAYKQWQPFQHFTTCRKSTPRINVFWRGCLCFFCDPTALLYSWFEWCCHYLPLLIARPAAQDRVPHISAACTWDVVGITVHVRSFGLEGCRDFSLPVWAIVMGLMCSKPHVGMPICPLWLRSMRWNL